MSIEKLRDRIDDKIDGIKKEMSEVKSELKGLSKDVEHIKDYVESEQKRSSERSKINKFIDENFKAIILSIIILIGGVDALYLRHVNDVAKNISESVK